MTPAGRLDDDPVLLILATVIKKLLRIGIKCGAKFDAKFLLRMEARHE
jgi:hypothetical protein